MFEIKKSAYRKNTHLDETNTFLILLRISNFRGHNLMNFEN